MIRKIPVVATPIYLKDLFYYRHLFKKGLDPKEQFINSFGNYIGAKYTFLFNSATSSFYIILTSLKRISEKREVILPAYTASSLVLAVRKAGLIPVFCDISLDDFNMDLKALPGLVNKDTLCIVGVHMFGIPMEGLEEIKAEFPGVFLVEDCAQSLGSRLKGRLVGNTGDISLFSFNRGKNLPTYGGGCIATNSVEVAEEIKKASALFVEKNNLFLEWLGILKIIALYVAVKPHLYGALHFLISPFREQSGVCDFSVRGYTDFNASVALSILKGIDKMSKARYENGMKIIKALKLEKDIITPRISEDTQPAFNRLPIVFKDLHKRRRIKNELRHLGIESSYMYTAPLATLTNSVYLSGHLLTIPVHPLVGDKEIDRIIKTIRNT